MAYEKQTWVDNETVIKASMMQHIEDGIYQNVEDIASNANDINEIKESVSENEKSIASNTSQIEENTESISQNASDIAELSNSLAELDTSLSEVNSALADKSTIKSYAFTQTTDEYGVISFSSSYAPIIGCVMGSTSRTAFVETQNRIRVYATSSQPPERITSTSVSGTIYYLA